MSQIVSDDLGRSFEIVEKDKIYIRGKECLNRNIEIVSEIAEMLGSSLGPTGLDKIIVDEDDNITITNDGATILGKIDMKKNGITEMIRELSESQDKEVGDGTTSIVVLGNGIIREMKRLIDRGIHEIKIIEGLKEGLKIIIEHMRKTSEEMGEGSMVKIAKTTNGTKISQMSEIGGICVEMMNEMIDDERKEVDMDNIKIIGKIGKNMNETRLIRGIVMMKEMSHVQMKKEIKNGRIALLSCGFEPPKLKNKNKLEIKTAEEYRELEKYEKRKFEEMIMHLKRCRVDVVMCQWGFDDEANSLLMQSGISAVRWVGGHDLGLIAVQVGGSIVSRFEELTEEDIGHGNVSEEKIGLEGEKMIIVESSKRKSMTMLVRGSNEYIVEETKRSIWDVINVIRSAMKCGRMVYGGGNVEIGLSLELEKKSHEYDYETGEILNGLGRGVLEIPYRLALNSGYEPIGYVEELRESYSLGNKYIGVDCNEIGEKNMKKAGVCEVLRNRERQYEMAVDLVSSILKIEEVLVD